ncbi:MAG: hypothetical protein ACOCXQ_03825 [Patescibacteria group bacterium]
MNRRIRDELNPRIQEAIYLIIGLFFWLMVIVVPAFFSNMLINLVDAGIGAVNEDPYYSAEYPAFSAQIGRSPATSGTGNELLDVLTCSIGNQEQIKTQPLSPQVFFKADARPSEVVRCVLLVSRELQISMDVRSIDTIRVDDGSSLKYLDNTTVVLVRKKLELRFVTFPGFEESLHGPWYDTRQVILEVHE